MKTYRKVVYRISGGLLSFFGVAIFTVGTVGTLKIFTEAYIEVDSVNVFDFWIILLIPAGLLALWKGNHLQGRTPLGFKKSEAQ